METTTRRLTKSRTERMIDGVCGGVAEYFHLDVTLVRLTCVLLTLFGGTGLILYIAGMIVMPAGPAVTPSSTTAPTVQSSTRFWGILLIGVGIFWLLSNMGIFFWHHWWDFSWNILLPTLMILVGVAFIYGGRNYIASTSEPVVTPPAGEPGAAAEGEVPPAAEQTATTASPFTMARRLYRSRTERKLFGVCGGLGVYFGLDPTIVRLVFIMMALASFGFILLLYIVMAIVVPEEPLVVQHT